MQQDMIKKNPSIVDIYNHIQKVNKSSRGGKVMAILDNIRNVMNKVIRIVCILLFAFMVIIGTYQILVRYIFNSPSTVSEELLTYSFTWMSLFAAAYVFGKREHMRMGFLADKLNKKKLTILNVIIEIIIIAFALDSNGLWWHIHYKPFNDTKNCIAWNSNGICIYRYSHNGSGYCSVWQY